MAADDAERAYAAALERVRTAGGDAAARAELQAAKRRVLALRRASATPKPAGFAARGARPRA